MRCASCGFENAGAVKFCGECGRKLAAPAPARYTPPHLAERLLAEQAALEARGSGGERKTVTALFADIKGAMELIEGLGRYAAIGGGLHLPLFLGLFAEALMKSGKLDEAERALDEAFESAARSGEVGWNADLHRLRGDLQLAASGDPPFDAAEGHFRRAMEVAREQGARSFELRAATRLARLLVRRGEGAEARPMLAGIYDWFTEGFGTADLLEAKALLDELLRTPAAPVAGSRGRLPERGEQAALESPTVFRREGNSWTISYEGKTLRLKDTKGLRYLAFLLTSPGRDLDPIELDGVRGEPASTTAAERERVNRTKAIRASMARIAREHPGLGRHLEATIHTGRLFSYTPDPRVPVGWAVSLDGPLASCR